MVASLLGLGLALGCVSSEAEREGVSPRGPLDRQLGRADDAFDGRAYRQALDMYSALYLAALSGGYDDLAAEAAAQASTINALQGAGEESDRWMSFAERYAEGEGDGARSRVMLARGIRQWKQEDSGAALGTRTSVRLLGLPKRRPKVPSRSSPAMEAEPMLSATAAIVTAP